METTVHEHRDRLPATEVGRIEAAVAALRQAAQGDSAEAIRRASDELQQLSHAMAQQLYQQSQTNAAHAAGSSGRSDDVKEGEVVDA